MRIKSFFASTVDAALAEARRELGPEAMLIESRRSGPEWRRLGEHEVVCAVTSDTAPANGRRTRPSPSSEEVRRGATAGTAPEGWEALLNRVERIASTLERAEGAALRIAAPPESIASLKALESAGVDPQWIGEILSRAQSEYGDMSQAAGSMIRVDSSLGNSGAAQGIVAVVGPSGAGKTATLVKLAARFGFASRRPSLLISADTQRVAGTEPLRSYAAILGAGFLAVESPRALRQAIEEHRGKEWIWIDTPGWSRNEIDEARDLMNVLAADPEVDTHLVLPASMRAADLAGAAARFDPCRPSKLLFTRLDECSSFGVLLNETARTGLPVSFLCSGPQIPEDLEPADKQRIASLILHGAAPEKKAVSAAA